MRLALHILEPARSHAVGQRLRGAEIFVATFLPEILAHAFILALEGLFLGYSERPMRMKLKCDDGPEAEFG